MCVCNPSPTLFPRHPLGYPLASKYRHFLFYILLLLDFGLMSLILQKDEIEESLQSAMLVDDPFQVTEADLMPTAASSPPHASSDLGEGFPSKYRVVELS